MKALADLLFPHITKTPADYYAQFPPRDLPSGAKVTRIAPSPTGFVHIGTLMTALVNRQLAHQTGGIFFLRIEDTDKKREIPRSVEEIIINLINYALTPDEGYVSVDPLVERGAYGPYIQSQRVEIYETFAKYMVEQGVAYPCFCTEDELDRLRKTQEAQGVARPGYYGDWAVWRNATFEQIKERIDVGERPVIRIRAPYPNEARVRFKDVIKGDIDMPANDLDSVLLKSNSLPTYHFAHVIDDTLMHVNPIIRGDEWLSSAPLHIQTFEYLGLPVPDFAHVAPMAKMDGTSKRKISKRKDPEANVMYYYEAGYPVRAVSEYLLNLANSGFYDWSKANPGQSYQNFPINLDAMGVSMPLFDLVKLNDISKDVIATYSAEQVYEYGLAWAKQYSPRLGTLLEADPGYSIAVFNLERTGQAPRKDIVNWSDIDRACGFFFDELYAESIAVNLPLPAYGEEVITAILERVRQFDASATKEAWLDGMRALGETLGFARDAKTFKKNPESFKGHFGDVMMVVRAALTGRTNTPDLYEILKIMGQSRINQRIDQILARLGENQP
ncbi:MAG: glutamate--tRNA ligase [Chloroflexi bacterium]|uniref:glutamate--tRNA ligase n=1 Tax=Candidatus Flexifilum breve TaxID=3140694 RepID=UPI0031373DE8|nr:glutamate--tRNA ligase [Chloroflexota bacterium]